MLETWRKCGNNFLFYYLSVKQLTTNPILPVPSPASCIRSCSIKKLWWQFLHEMDVKRLKLWRAIMFFIFVSQHTCDFDSSSDSGSVFCFTSSSGFILVPSSAASLTFSTSCNHLIQALSLTLVPILSLLDSASNSIKNFVVDCNVARTPLENHTKNCFNSYFIHVDCCKFIKIIDIIW